MLRCPRRWPYDGTTVRCTLPLWPLHDTHVGPMTRYVVKVKGEV